MWVEKNTWFLLLPVWGITWALAARQAHAQRRPHWLEGWASTAEFHSQSTAQLNSMKNPQFGYLGLLFNPVGLPSRASSGRNLAPVHAYVRACVVHFPARRLTVDQKWPKSQLNDPEYTNVTNLLESQFNHICFVRLLMHMSCAWRCTIWHVEGIKMKDQTVSTKFKEGRKKKLAFPRRQRKRECE